MNHILLNNLRVLKVRKHIKPETALKKIRKVGHKAELCIHPPSQSLMERWVDQGFARTTDGCKVEPDGICEHGKESWLIVYGVI